MTRAMQEADTPIRESWSPCNLVVNPAGTFYLGLSPHRNGKSNFREDRRPLTRDRPTPGLRLLEEWGREEVLI